MTSGAWKAVDARAREEIARRRPPTKLVERAGKIADILEREFPKARSALSYSTPLELLVATILSAQCTDARVNQVTPAMFRRYPTAAAYAESPPGELEKAIRSTGFFNSKAKSIRACCRELVDKHGGKVPREVESLASLPGVGRKTAAVVRSNAFDLPGLAVDTHFRRISQRLELTDDEDPVRIEFDVGSLLPPERWSVFGHAVILHGRKTCTARKPDCPRCPVREMCPSADTFRS
jgi:endonuclease-3